MLKFRYPDAAQLDVVMAWVVHCQRLMLGLAWEKGSGTNSQMARRVLRTIGSWYLISDEISFGLQETVEVGLISVCSRNHAAIQIDFSVGALTPRVSVIVWLVRVFKIARA